MELGDSSIDCSFILKRMLQLVWFFFLMFILKEKLINSILIKIPGCCAPSHCSHNITALLSANVLNPL